MYNDYPTIYETNINQYMIYYIMFAIIMVVILVFTMISLAKVFKKANRSGISAIIPLYNIIVLLEITNLPKWYFILLLIPGVNIVFNIFIMMELARLFRRSKAFGLGLVFLPFIFYPILAFSDCEYVGLNLVAKEQKSIAVELPKVSDEENNPVINESFDDKNKNIILSIGGGVYQKDYTDTLLNIDEKQVIVDKAIKTEVPVVNDNLVIEENKATNEVSNISQNVMSKDILANDKSYVELMSNGVVYKDEPVINNSDVAINHQSNENINISKFSSDEFVNCLQCGARIKKSAGVCFLCGKTLD